MGNEPLHNVDDMADIVFSEEELGEDHVPEEDRGGDFDPVGGDVIAALDAMIEETPEARRARKKEALRLMLTDAMRRARKQAGLTQAQVAERLGDGVSQSWVSKLESANYDHQIESVLDYLDALGAELGLSILTKHGTIRVNYAELAGEGSTHYVLRGARGVKRLPRAYAKGNQYRYAAA